MYIHIEENIDLQKSSMTQSVSPKKGLLAKDKEQREKSNQKKIPRISKLKMLIKHQLMQLLH